MRVVQTTPHHVGVEQRPAPVPTDGELVVRVLAGSVNLVDKFVVDGFFHQIGVIAHSDPVGLGWDLVGIVEGGPRGGERVAAVRTGMDTALGTLGELITVREADAAVVPAELSTPAAAAVGMNALAAAQALDLAGAPEGRTLLVTGAAGSVGGYLIELAAAAGWKVTAVARSGDADFVGRAGAELLTELPPPGLRQWDVVVDAAGVVFEPDALATKGAPYVAAGGRFVGVRGVVPPPAGADFTTTAISVEADGARLADLLRRAAAGEITPRVGPVFPLDRIAEAIDAVGTRGLRGRVLVEVSPEA